MQATILSRLGRDASIVLIRLRSLGDTVLATPAFRVLRRALPGSGIHVVMESRFADILRDQPDIDGVLRVCSPASLGDKLRLVRRIRALRPQLCLDMHGGATAAWLTALSGARWRSGFAHFRHSWAYNARIPRAQEVLGRATDAPVHTAEHHAAAIFHLGAEAGDIPRARLGTAPVRAHPPYAVLHAGAAYATKRWAADRFRSLASELRREHGLEPVFAAGPGEAGLAAAFPSFQVRQCRCAEDLTNLLSGATLFVGNDSGPAHVAAALGVPCVVLFGSSDSAAWRPWRTASRVVETQWGCKPCPGDRCYEFDEPRCILSVRRSEVSQAVSELLAAEGGVT